MSQKKLVSYLRVSTQKQGRSGLGLDAQQASIDAYALRTGATVLATYTEVESGSVNERQQLNKALLHARVTGATLVIAKLDRLSRNAAFLLTLQESGVKFIAADMPDANELTVGIMALLAQQERQWISTRTRAALQAAKARGRQLGNPHGAAALRRAAKGNAAATDAVRRSANAYALMLKPVVEDVAEACGRSASAMARELNARGIQTPRGAKWHTSSVRNLLTRLETLGKTPAAHRTTTQ